MGRQEERAVPLPEGWLLGQGRFVLERVLGTGGFGITYQAYDRSAWQTVAIKELYPRGYLERNAKTGMLTETEGKQQQFKRMRQRFKEEAQVIYSFRDRPEILKVYALFDENNTSYYVMEFLTGESLQNRIEREGKCGWPFLREIAWTVLNSIRILHERNLIHRDISPDNIFLQKDGGVKLIDFGSVRNYVEADHFTTILKDHFAPPEQYVQKSAQGPQTDIYALSATFYYALSGKLPAKSVDRKSALAQGKSDSLVPLRLLEPSLPDYVTQAIEKGMHLEIHLRFTGAEQMREALFPQQTAAGRESVRWIVCTAGRKKGCTWAIRKNQTLELGRGEGCAMKYQADTAGVSRRHCSFYLHENGTVYVKDNRSTYGTYLNQRQIMPERWYPVGSRDQIRAGAEWFSVR